MNELFELFYLSKNTFGGWVTYTAHLYRALEKVGLNPHLYKVTKRTEKTTRDFGYGLRYKNTGAEGVAKIPLIDPCLIVAVQKNFYGQAIQLLDKGAWIVIHDPTELRNKEFRDVIHQHEDRVIVIRKSMLKHLPYANFIPHPYVRYYKDEVPTMDINAIHVGRIDFDKNIDMVLDANRILPKKKQIVIFGFDNRIYTRFNIVEKYPEYQQSKNDFPREWHYATRLCHRARFLVDMSAIKGDGGGSQYTFLEAIDAGAVCVLNREWCKVKGEMKPGVNCLTAYDAKELAEILKSYGKHAPPKMLNELRTNARKLLRRHSPTTIGRKYKELICPSFS